MSTSTNAILAYGHDLGGGDEEFRFPEINDDSVPPWYDEDDDDFAEQVMKRLLAVHGFTETDWRVDGYYERKRAAEAAIGVEIESHCSGDYPMYILAAKVITVHRGDVKTIDPAMLLDGPDRRHWDNRLAWAVEALGITPEQQEPAWLLCSYWG